MSGVLSASKKGKSKEKAFGAYVHLCLVKAHLLSLINKSVADRHSIIFAACVVLYSQLEQLMCENYILALSELSWEPQK